MKKSPEGESPEGSDPEHEEIYQLREDLRKQGLTDDQISEMMIRVHAEELFDPNRKPQEPEFIYRMYEENLGRPLTDLEKIEIKAGLLEDQKNLRKHFGVDDEGKIKKS